RWDLDGDGNYGDGLGPTAGRRFSLPGSYTVGLQVADTSGAAATARKTIVVADPSSPTTLATLRPIFPSPVVRLAGTIMDTGIRVRRLTASAPDGTRTA